MKARRLLPAALVVALTEAAAWAKDGFEAPGEAKTDWMSIVVMAVAALAVCAIGFKNAKRMHMD